MFTHAFLGSNDIEKSRKFYDATMGVLGYQNVVPPEAGQLVYAGPTGTFIVGKPLNGEPATHANGGTIGFKATSSEQVDRFHAAGLAAGGKCEGEPGLRPQYGIYAAYLRDPDGNKICAIAQAAQ